MEYAAAFMIGTSAVFIGLSLIFRPAEWQAYMRHIKAQGTGASLIIGYLHLIIGTFIVGFHWVWTGLPLLLTLIGVKAIAEGITYTLFPQSMSAMIAWYEPRFRQWCRIGGMITIIIGLLVLCEWRAHMWPDCVDWNPCFNKVLQ